MSPAKRGKFPRAIDFTINDHNLLHPHAEGLIEAFLKAQNEEHLIVTNDARKFMTEFKRWLSKKKLSKSAPPVFPHLQFTRLSLYNESGRLVLHVHSNYGGVPFEGVPGDPFEIHDNVLKAVRGFLKEKIGGDNFSEVQSHS